MYSGTFFKYLFVEKAKHCFNAGHKLNYRRDYLQFAVDTGPTSPQRSWLHDLCLIALVSAPLLTLAHSFTLGMDQMHTLAHQAWIRSHSCTPGMDQMHTLAHQAWIRCTILHTRHGSDAHSCTPGMDQMHTLAHQAWIRCTLLAL